MSETFEQLVARVNSNGFVPTKEKRTVMAQKIVEKADDFKFRERRVGGTPKYPWDDWFDGNLWLLERSEGEENEKGTIESPTVERDFGVSVNAMIPKLNTAARRRYKVVQISRENLEGKKLKNALIIRSRPMTEEERQAEDVLRAEEREALKARRAEARAEAKA